MRRRGNAEVDELLKRVLPREARPDREEEGAEGFADGEPEQYADVDDYDAVLRWHCRL